MLENRGLPFHLKANLHQEPSRILAKAVKALKKDSETFAFNHWETYEIDG